MSLLKSKLLFSATRQLSTGPILNAYWNHEWKPNPLPKTEKEHLEAAKKYGLLQQEYKPGPDEGDGAGDYPYLEPLSVEARDQFYPWDYPEYRRNYAEVIQENFNLYTDTRWNVNLKYKFPAYAKLASFFGTVGLSYLLYYLGEGACFSPFAKQHIPAPGEKHYTY